MTIQRTIFRPIVSEVRSCLSMAFNGEVKGQSIIFIYKKMCRAKDGEESLKYVGDQKEYQVVALQNFDSTLKQCKKHVMDDICRLEQMIQ